MRLTHPVLRLRTRHALGLLHACLLITSLPGCLGVAGTAPLHVGAEPSVSLAGPACPSTPRATAGSTIDARATTRSVAPHESRIAAASGACDGTEVAAGPCAADSSTVVTAGGADGSGPADEPGADQPSADQPGTDEPSADQPATDAPGADQPSPEGLAALQRLTAGAEALARGDAAEALLLLESSPGATPAEADRHFLLGVALLQLERLPEALAELRVSAELQPGDISTHCVLARVLRALGDLGGAVDALRFAVALDPADAHLHTLLGHLLLEQDDAGAAFDELLAAVELDPAEVDAHRGLALVFASSGDPAHAELAWRQAIALSPDVAMLHAGLASALRAQGQPAAALVESTRALELEPGNAVHAANVASTLALVGQLDASRAAFRSALLIGLPAGEQRALVHANFGDLLERMGDPDGAGEQYEAALAEAPELASAREALGMLLLDSGDDEGARQQLGRALADGGLMPESLMHLALLDEAAGDGEQARRCAQLLAAGDSGSPDVAFRHAQLLVFSADAGIRDLDAAIGILRDLLALTGDTTGAVWNLLGEALARQGSFAGAVEAASRAVELAGPDHPASARYLSLREECLAGLAGR